MYIILSIYYSYIGIKEFMFPDRFICDIVDFLLMYILYILSVLNIILCKIKSISMLVKSDYFLLCGLY